jgi:acetoin utilization deacetylase AcuC-like enzyme
MGSLTFYVWDEMNQFHNAGWMQNTRLRFEPVKHWESPETKRRLHTLLSVSGVLDHTTALRPRAATKDELCRVHVRSYVDQVEELSKDETKGHHTCGDRMLGDAATFAPGGYEVACLAAGAAIVAAEAVYSQSKSNGYVLMRPPGHHAEPDQGMGFCVFNNIAVAAAHLMDTRGVQRVGIIDFDVHHGNGTQKIFEADPRVLFISLHQDSNYPLHSGKVEEKGVAPSGEGYTINIPLPPGSGSGAYRATFERVVEPAMSLFKPQIILISCGFDASYLDPLSAQILGASDYAFMTDRIMKLADESCEGRVLFCHEGGYSEVYVPYCGLAVLETLTGFKTSIEDPYAYEVSNWGGQEVQAHQEALINKVLTEHEGFKRLGAN